MGGHLGREIHAEVLQLLRWLRGLDWSRDGHVPLSHQGVLPGMHLRGWHGVLWLTVVKSRSRLVVGLHPGRLRGSDHLILPGSFGGLEADVQVSVRSKTEDHTNMRLRNRFSWSCFPLYSVMAARSFKLSSGVGPCCC